MTQVIAIPIDCQLNSRAHEPWFEPNEEFQDRFDEKLHEFARFHGTEDVEVIESRPKKG